jgi:hypothetical protein
MGDAKTMSVTIPENEAVSGYVDLGNHSLIAFEMPEVFDSTTITFQGKAKVSEDVTGGQLEDLDNIYDDAGTELSVTVAPNRIVGLKADKASVLSAIRYLRVRSGTAASPVNVNPGVEIRLLVK